jgi:hypothetical protein
MLANCRVRAQFGIGAGPNYPITISGFSSTGSVRCASCPVPRPIESRGEPCLRSQPTTIDDCFGGLTGAVFSTYDRDLTGNCGCVASYKGGWWYTCEPAHS